MNEQVVTIIFGDIHFCTGGKAIVESIKKEVELVDVTIAEAERFAEHKIANGIYDAYIILETFGGRIVYLCEEPKKKVILTPIIKVEGNNFFLKSHISMGGDAHVKLNKGEAALLYAELHTFIMGDEVN